jgi:hypothetical protein
MPILACAQSNSHRSQLLYIKYYPIKTEDGCSFFSDNLSALKQKKYLLNINFEHIAYIQTADYKFIYFKRIRRAPTAGGYTDFYKGKNGEFKLVINSIKKGENYTTIREGTLFLNVGNIKKKLTVYGNVQDNDYINKKLFGH